MTVANFYPSVINVSNAYDNPGWFPTVDGLSAYWSWATYATGTKTGWATGWNCGIPAGSIINSVWAAWGTLGNYAAVQASCTLYHGLGYNLATYTNGGTLAGPNASYSMTLSGSVVPSVASLNASSGSSTSFCLKFAASKSGTSGASRLDMDGIYIMVDWTPLSAPTITTTSSISSLTSVSATSGATGIVAGNPSITDRGICWGTSTGPVYTGDHSHPGTVTGTADFTATTGTLIPGTTYHLRSWALNGIDVGYGPEVDFTTLSEGHTAMTMGAGKL